MLNPFAKKKTQDPGASDLNTNQTTFNGVNGTPQTANNSLEHFNHQFIHTFSLTLAG